MKCNLESNKSKEQKVQVRAVDIVERSRTLQ